MLQIEHGKDHGFISESKRHGYASEEHRIRLEDQYKKAWIAQNKKDVLEKPELKIRSHFKSEKE